MTDERDEKTPGSAGVRARIDAALRHRGHLVLDGPTGTALEAKGYRLHEILWTATAAVDAPELLAAVHHEYLRAGAELITANTFRTTAHAAQAAGSTAEAAQAWMSAAVEVARAACAGASGGALCAGSLAPLADCYRPERTPPDEVLRAAHAQTAGWLWAAGCDLILVETQGSGREAAIAVAAAHAAGAPVWVSLLPGADGEHLLDGSPLLEAAVACVRGGAEAVLLNCAHHEVIERALRALQPLRRDGVRLGAYANAARLLRAPDGLRFVPEPSPLGQQVAEYAATAQRWRDTLGAVLLGGCCGMTPAHIRALAALPPARG
ncbi:MAG: homocysteine S-methyltransferase family protein [Polyangia bacterium]